MGMYVYKAVLLLSIVRGVLHLKKHGPNKNFDLQSYVY